MCVSGLLRGVYHRSIITYAAIVHTAQEAADILAKDGIEIEIIDLPARSARLIAKPSLRR